MLEAHYMYPLTDVGAVLMCLWVNSRNKSKAGKAVPLEEKKY